MALSGYKIKPRAANAPDGYSNIDAYVNGHLFEFKSPEAQWEKPLAGKELDFIDRNLHKAVKQFYSQYDPTTGGTLQYNEKVSIVLNLRYRPVDTKEAKKAIKKSMKKRSISEVLLITANGRVISIT